MGNAAEWREMMLAVAVDADVTQHDEVIIAAGLVELARKHFGRIDPITGKILFERRDHPPWCLAQPLTRRFVAGPGYERAHRRLRFTARGTLWGRGLLQGRGPFSIYNVIHRFWPARARRSDGDTPC
jgi:hypothetical protein